MSCGEALGASAAKRQSAPASIVRIRGRVVGARGGGIDERRRSSGRAIDGVFRLWSVGGVTRGWELERLAGTSSKEGVVRHALRPHPLPHHCEVTVPSPSPMSMRQVRHIFSQAATRSHVYTVYCVNMHA